MCFLSPNKRGNICMVVVTKKLLKIMLIITIDELGK